MTDSTEWQEQWTARLAALESVFGKSDDLISHAVVPFEFGRDAGGAADVVRFRNWRPCVLYVTAELIGNADQLRSSLGNYELAMAHAIDDEWGATLISRLAQYTLEACLEPGQTMDIGSAVPQGSTLSALLFTKLADVPIRREAAGVLMCTGITARELQFAFDHGGAQLAERLHAAGVLPVTDVTRASVV